MNVSHMGRRLATAGVATALAAAGLVGAGSTAANAAEATTTYSCGYLTGAAPTAVKVVAPALDAVTEIAAGTPVPAGFLNLGGDHAVDISVTVPAAVAAVMSTAGLTSIDGDMAMLFGSSSVPVTDLKLAGVTPNPDGSATIAVTGTNGAFSVPEAGPQNVAMPSDFTMSPTLGGDLGTLDIACHSDAAQSLKSMTVLKNGSATGATPVKKSFHKGTAAKIRAVVTGDTLTPSGTVKATRGSKTYTGKLNDKGVAVINLGKKLKVGQYKFVVKYAGSGFHQASQAAKAVVVKVVR